MSDPWTLRRVIGWIQSDFEGRGIESARLEADLLASHGLGLTRIQLYLDLDRPLIPTELAAIRGLVERRRKFEPIAYILGDREFYGRRFEVTPAVLIPRPDTEALVERALALLENELPEGPILDLCTGSGCIAVSLLLGATDRSATATDLSEDALAVARKNAEQLGALSRLTLRQGDLFEALDGADKFACITANPPYIGADEMPGLAPDVREFEPRMALDAGADALVFYRRVAEEAPRHLLPGGALLVEVGFTQADAVCALFEAAGFSNIKRHEDLGGIERVIEGTLG